MPPVKQMQLVLRLPSHVTVLFIAIFVALCAITLAGMQTQFALSAFFVFLFAIFVPLRALLIWVDRERWRWCSRSETSLQPVVSKLSAELGLKGVIYIERANREVGIHVVGGLKRRLILAGTSDMDAINQYIESSDAATRQKGLAVLSHELQHFLRNDTRYLELTRQFLSSMTQLSLYITIAGIGWYWVSQLYAPYLLPILNDPVAVANMPFGDVPLLGNLLKLGLRAPSQDDAKFLETFVLRTLAITFINAFGPLFLACGLLWRFVFHRMIHVREYYADYGAAQHQGAEALKLAMIDEGTRQLPNAKQQNQLARLHFSGHPSSDARRRALRNPIEALTEPQSNGNMLGAFIIFVYMALASFFAIGTLVRWPAHWGVLVGFIAIAMLMTPAVLGQSYAEVWPKIRKCASRTFLIGFSWNLGLTLLAVILLLFIPQTMSDTADIFIPILDVIIPNANMTSDTLQRFWQNIWVNLLSIPLGAILLAGGLWIDTRLKQHYLTPLISSNRPLQAACWIITLSVAGGIFILLSLGTALLALDIRRLFDIWFLLVITILGCSLGGVWLWHNLTR